MSLDDEDNARSLGRKAPPPQRPQPQPRRQGYDPYAQVREPRGVVYGPSLDGKSYTQLPETYRASPQNIQRGVLPRMKRYLTDASDWIFNSGD